MAEMTASEDIAGTVLVIASHFPPLQSAGVHRTTRFVRYLPEFGWHVHVLTQRTTAFPRGTTRDDELLKKVPKSVRIHRSTAVYPIEIADAIRRKVPFTGSSRAGVRTPNNGVENETCNTKSVDVHTLHRNGMLQRLKDSLTIPLMTPDRWIGWVPFATRMGRRAISDNDINCIYSTGPPFSNHLVAMRLSKTAKLPWIADFRDPWVGAAFKPERRDNHWVGRQHQRLEREVIRRATQIITTTEGIANDLRCRYPEMRSKICVISNGYDPADFIGLTASAPKEHRRPMVITHAGSFYGRRSAKGMIDAVESCISSGALSRDAIRLRLIGGIQPGRTVERDLVTKAGLQDIVQLLPQMPHAECMANLQTADVLLLVQTSAPACIPGKVFEYIAVGKPIFTLTDDGATADFVRRENLGPCVDPNDIEMTSCELVKIVRSFAAGDRMTSTILSTQKKYDGRNLTHQLSEELQSLLSNDVPRP